ncbi:MAG: two-component system sensor histidine kinase NtrB [Candidatus Acidiferrales bacterium]
MAYLFYARLIGLTAGTLVYLFLIALILGHRRPRLFERLLFFLILSLFLVYAGGLLEINAGIQYGSMPDATRLLCTVLMGLGMLFLLPLIVHTHFEYAQTEQQAHFNRWAKVGVWCVYLIPIGQLIGLGVVSAIFDRPFGKLLLSFVSLNPVGNLATCAAVAGVGQRLLLRREKIQKLRNLWKWLLGIFIFLSLVQILRVGYMEAGSPFVSDELVTATIVAGAFPGVLLIYWALRHNFVEYGNQRNLVYALSGTFLALLYLALVRRVSGWLEPVLPPEATASILLFVLIFLFEPVERLVGPVLHRQFQRRVGHLQQLTLDIQTDARNGNIAELIGFAERRIREEFGLAVVRISVPREAGLAPLESPGGLGHVARLPLMKDGGEIGLLEAATTGSYLTGETSAALEFLAEQLPASIDLCRLIGEKLQLERELAERERLAGLGQMAANISHNLRNPLSSMKTVLQVQLENPELPLDMRRDCSLVVNEIDRMSAKLTQLLRYAKPSVNGERVGAVALARQTASLFGRDAEQRNIRLEFDQPREEIAVLGSEEALGEVLSNLIVNAMEAQPNGGRIRVGLSRNGDFAEIRVDDDGPGISEELRAKIFQPYFTTKPTGTGLGLSIVARRIAEMGGTIECESPLRDGTGTRFRVTLSVSKN